MIKHTTKHQKLGWVLFLIYLAQLVYFLFFAEAFGRTDSARSGYCYNLTPFKEIMRFWIYREKLGMKAFLLNIVGNVVAFMPAGFFLPIISRKGEKWGNTVIIGFGFSFVVELTQLVFQVGTFDVDDLILNTAGAALGHILYQIVQETRIWRRRRARRK